MPSGGVLNFKFKLAAEVPLPSQRVPLHVGVIARRRGRLCVFWQVVGGTAERIPSHCECIHARLVDFKLGWLGLRAASLVALAQAAVAGVRDATSTPPFQTTSSSSFFSSQFKLLLEPASPLRPPCLCILGPGAGLLPWWSRFAGRRGQVGRP